MTNNTDEQKEADNLRNCKTDFGSEEENRVQGIYFATWQDNPGRERPRTGSVMTTWQSPVLLLLTSAAAHMLWGSFPSWDISGQQKQAQMALQYFI